MQLYDAYLMKKRFEDAERKRSAREKKHSAGGKTYTHNVKG
jgi:hypothetical protein